MKATLLHQLRHYIVQGWHGHTESTATEGKANVVCQHILSFGHGGALQNTPYLNKFEAPEALDRCIRILSARSSFLAWF